MSRLTVEDGTGVRLGAVLAKAGEGSVYEVTGRPELVAKVFHTALAELSEKLDKVAAMVASPPPGAVQDDGFVVLTWPQQVLFDAGHPVGYLMARVDTATAVEIHTLSNPFNRANPLPGAPRWTANATWAHLLNVAANLCLAVDVVHRVDAVIGDFQERNILVSDTTRVTLVDCDSMQFACADGRQFLCAVARPEFTAPELGALNLRTHPREKSSDLFALAVHIYQLLMGGNHPFMRGVWTGAGDQPDALSLATAGWWAGGPASPLTSHPLAPPAAFLPPAITGLFTRAFTDGAHNPPARPAAAEWRRALLDIRTTLCPQQTHHIPVGSFCPWCAIDNQRRRRKYDSMNTATRWAAERPLSAQRHLSMGPGWIPTPVSQPSHAYDNSGTAIAAAGAGIGPPSPVTGTPGFPVTWPSAPTRGRRALIATIAACAVMIAILAVISIAAIASRLKEDRAFRAATTAASDQNTTPTTWESSYSAPSTSGSSYSAPTTSESAQTDAEATARAIINAQVGECIHRTVHKDQSHADGTFDVSVSPANCGSNDATDKVIKRTDNRQDCHGDFVFTKSSSTEVVLCLAKL